MTTVQWAGGGRGGTPLPRGEGWSAEELLTDPACVLGRCHGVAHRPRVCEDLVVVPTLRRHGADAGATWLLLGQGCCHPGAWGHQRNRTRNEDPAILPGGEHLFRHLFLAPRRGTARVLSYQKRVFHLPLNCSLALEHAIMPVKEITMFP